MASKPEWWIDVVREFLRERRPGKITLNCKGDGVVASIDRGDHLIPPRDTSGAAIYWSSACGVTKLDRGARIR